jgi:hypothetical protein
MRTRHPKVGFHGLFISEARWTSDLHTKFSMGRKEYWQRHKLGMRKGMKEEGLFTKS